jgi:ribosomal peptide maturation radical SAM protein 1
MSKVLLLSMPFGALERQALGLSLLKACLAEAGIVCDVRYLTFAFAEFIGYDDYRWLSNDLPYTAFAGDWAFTHALYGERPGVDARYIQDVLRDTWRLDEAAVSRLQRIRALVEPFVDYCLAGIDWSEYAVVGFTSTFEQNIASLALSRRIKAAFPDIAIVFGGANWEGEMGEELHKRFPCVDFVCSGEAETSFPALVNGILSGAPATSWADSISGIVYRAAGTSVATGQVTPIRDLDALPYPDYADYFRDLEESTVGASVVPGLLIETSRGCWWGAKSHCTFCGLNGSSLAFRSKSATRALAELDFLVDRWRIDMVEAVDNILDMRYFHDFLPALAEAPRRVHLFYEVKANLSRQQVRTLREAGVYRIQPGLESMSDHVLKLMRKGTTALRNIQLLKWCHAEGIAVDWNVLYGFPGETREDYVGMLDLLRAIRFLSPATGWGPIRLDRFSPYFEDPAAYGFTNVRPMVPYSYLYPFDVDSLHRIAYYFDYDYQPSVDPTGYATEVIAFVQDWRQNPERGRLSEVLGPDCALVLIDTRSDATMREVTLTGLERAAYEFCDSLRSASAVVRHLRERFPDVQVCEERVLGFLDSLVANRLMVSDGAHYLSLAITDSIPDVANGHKPRLQPERASSPGTALRHADRSAIPGLVSDSNGTVDEHVAIRIR